jgi:hypothetical protein
VLELGRGAKGCERELVGRVNVLCPELGDVTRTGAGVVRLKNGLSAVLFLAFGDDAERVIGQRLLQL